MMQGIRGAITVERNDKEEIIAAVVELLSKMQEKNGFQTEDVGAAIFSATDDLTAGFAAVGARKLGWVTVPLFGAQEQDVEDALEKCIRVLLLVNTDKKQREIEHVYLRGAKVLRPDLSK